MFFKKPQILNFNTYQELENLSRNLSSGMDNLTVDYTICWQHAERIVSTIANDLKKLTDIDFHVTRITFIISDGAYRQSARGCLMILKTELDKDFELSVECLIDHQRVMLQVRQSAATKELDRVARQIIKQYDTELKSELDSIKM